MSGYIRPKVKGASVFFTVALADRGSRLLVDEIGRLRESVAKVRAERPFVVNAWVVLPDHLHAVCTLPEGDADYSVRWSGIKAQFTMGLRRAGFSPPSSYPVVRSGRYAGLKPGLREGKREVAIWQRRFWEHHIRDEADFAAHVRYCWGNPVKHGFVEKAADWPYSSIHRDIRLGQVEPEWSTVVPDGEFGE
ncbi:MAG: REP-associated tyrosine transposase [Gemmobacter sp.]